MKRCLLALFAALTATACDVPLEVGDEWDAGTIVQPADSGSGLGQSGDAGWDGGGQVVNTPVTLGGYTLQPRSAAMHPMAFGSVDPDAGTGGAGVMAVISDHGDYCSTFPGCAIASPLEAPGTHLQLGVIGDVVKRGYPIGIRPGNAVLEFRKADADGRLSYRLRAESGLVTVTTYVPGFELRGTYDVTMEDGTLLQGSFAASFCYAMGLNIPGGGVSCSGYVDPSSNCSNACTCEQETVRADCTHTGNDNYTCTCTAVGGQVSTCTMSGLQGSMSACSAYMTCCPLTF